MMLSGLHGTDDIQSLIRSTADRYGVPQSLALAVAKQESGYNQSARGTSGEVGVFQLMPGTASGLGVDPYDLASNVDGGVRYLSQLLTRYGDTGTALAAYNAGPGNVDRGRIPTSTQQYVASVLSMANLITPDYTPTGPDTTVYSANNNPTGKQYGPSPITYDPATVYSAVVPPTGPVAGSGAGSPSGSPIDTTPIYTLTPGTDPSTPSTDTAPGPDPTTLLLLAAVAGFAIYTTLV